MSWNFSIGWFFLGLVIFVAGGAIVYFYKQISDNFLAGVNSYEKCKLVGIIVAIVGLIVMANLHTAILSLLVDVIFRR